MIPGQPHGQWPQQEQHVLPQKQTDMHQIPGVYAQGTVPFVIDLSSEADDDEGDLYELYGSQIPPPYAQDDVYGQPQPVTAPLVQVDRATIGHLVVATIVIYVTWVILQVFQRSMDRYLEQSREDDENYELCIASNTRELDRGADIKGYLS